MKIELKHRYRGNRTNLQWIEVGVYADDDPALFGLATYLVENDHAIVVEDDERKATEAEAAAIEDDERDMLKAQLDERGIEYDGRWSTERLRSVLAESEAE